MNFFLANKKKITSSSIFEELEGGAVSFFTLYFFGNLLLIGSYYNKTYNSKLIVQPYEQPNLLYSKDKISVEVLFCIP